MQKPIMAATCPARDKRYMNMRPLYQPQVMQTGAVA
jgi:hypothetical protein